MLSVCRPTTYKSCVCCKLGTCCSTGTNSLYSCILTATVQYTALKTEGLVPNLFFCTHRVRKIGWARRIPRPLNCFQKQRVGYWVGQGFVSRNASRNTCGCVQGEILLVPLISCSNETTRAWGESDIKLCR